MTNTGKVYCITNKKTGKKYVGATKLKYLSTRRILHYHAKGRIPYISKLLQKTPKEDWVWEILEDGLDKEQLRVREEFWIKELDTVNNGYNRSYGSISGARIKKKMHFWHPVEGSFFGYIDECMIKLGSKYKPAIIALNTGGLKKYKGWVKYENRFKYDSAKKPKIKKEKIIKRGMDVISVNKNGKPFAIGTCDTISKLLGCSKEAIRIASKTNKVQRYKLKGYSFFKIKKVGYSECREGMKYHEVILL